LYLSGVVTAAGEGTTHHLEEAQAFLPMAAESLELFRCYEAIHGQMFRPRGQVLTDGHDVNLVAT
jgi:hypothetical protein